MRLRPVNTMVTGAILFFVPLRVSPISLCSAVRAFATAVTAGVIGVLPSIAGAQTIDASASTSASDLPMGDLSAAGPPPARLAYLQYGVAFTAELATGGAFCEDPQLDCILGSGGGIAGRAGWRGSGDWYFGGAYELSKQDPTKLYRLAILQQLRFEARRYWFHGKDTQPVLALGAGLAGYGNEWGIATGGPVGFVGVGVESQVQNGPVLGFTVGYRPLFLVRFADETGHSHGPGFAHMFGIELALEARDPL